MARWLLPNTCVPFKFMKKEQKSISKDHFYGIPQEVLEKYGQIRLDQIVEKEQYEKERPIGSSKDEGIYQERH